MLISCYVRQKFESKLCVGNTTLKDSCLHIRYINKKTYFCKSLTNTKNKKLSGKGNYSVCWRHLIILLHVKRGKTRVSQRRDSFKSHKPRALEYECFVCRKRHSNLCSGSSESNGYGTALRSFWKKYYGHTWFKSFGSRKRTQTCKQNSARASPPESPFKLKWVKFIRV